MPCTGPWSCFSRWTCAAYRPVVKCLAALGIAFGIGMTALDLAVGMPAWWTIGEGPFIAALGFVLFWLAGHIDSGPAAAAGG